MSEQEEQYEREVEFANDGKQVVNNKAYQRAMVAVRGKIFEEFCNTVAEDTDVRDEKWRQMKVLDSIEAYFNDILTTGKLAEHSLKLSKQQSK